MSPTQGQGHWRERWGALLWTLSPQSRVFISFEADGEKELGLAWDYDIVLCLCIITCVHSLSSGGPNVGEGSECLGLTFCVSRQGTHWLSAWTESFLHLIFLVSYLLSEKTAVWSFIPFSSQGKQNQSYCIFQLFIFRAVHRPKCTMGGVFLGHRPPSSTRTCPSLKNVRQQQAGGKGKMQAPHLSVEEDD